MIASVKTMVTNNFIPYALDDIDIVAINIMFVNIAEGINKIVTKIRQRGFSMDDIQLENIDNITQVVRKTNNNIDKINKYFQSLNITLAENYLLGKEILETMAIDVINSDTTAVVTIFQDRIDIDLSNGQKVNIKQDSVTSSKDGDTQTIAHA